MTSAAIPVPVLQPSNASPLPSTIPAIPPEVCFIDNCLHKYDQEFPSNSGVCYNQQQDRYLAPSWSSKSGIELSNALQSVPRPIVQSIDRMSFWTTIFPLAIQVLKDQHPTEPKGRVASGFSIRHSPSWDQTQGKLQRAREAYENTAGISGNMKKGMRKIVETVPKLGGVVSMLPEIDTISPVVTVIKALLKVSQDWSHISMGARVDYVHSSGCEEYHGHSETSVGRI